MAYELYGGSWYIWLALVIVAILVLLALYWEYQELQRLKSRPSIEELDEPIPEYKYYACYNYENGVDWRGIFIATVVSVLAVAYILYSYKVELKFNLLLLIGLSIFGIFYLKSSFQNYHFYRHACDNVRNLT